MIAAGMRPIKKPSVTMMTASAIGPRISAPNPLRPRASRPVLQQFRQLGDIHRDPPRLILAEQIGG
jgi:hypothetical protein